MAELDRQNLEVIVLNSLLCSFSVEEVFLLWLYSLEILIF